MVFMPIGKELEFRRTVYNDLISFSIFEIEIYSSKKPVR
jgi:hypothetical protein